MSLFSSILTSEDWEKEKAVNKLIPREPTPEMLEVGKSWCVFPSHVWRDMHDAAPSVPSVEQELLEALERIASFGLSQFMGPHDMALECVNVAAKAVAKYRGE